MDEDINNKIYLICKTVIMFYIYMRERERCTISLGFDVSSFEVRCFGDNPLYKDNKLFLNIKWYNTNWNLFKWISTFIIDGRTHRQIRIQDCSYIFELIIIIDYTGAYVDCNQK